MILIALIIVMLLIADMDTITGEVMEREEEGVTTSTGKLTTKTRSTGWEGGREVEES